MKKKNKKRIVTTGNSGYNKEVTKVLIILVGVLVVLGLTYLIAGLMTGEIKFGKPETKTNTPAEIQYEEIIAGQIFNRPGDEYYVLLFDFTSNYASSYITYKDVYTKKENSLAFYLVDLEKGFNTTYVAQEEEFEEHPDSLEKLKVKSPTILKIAKHKVVDRIEGTENIEKFFEEAND